jgi:Holliday junction DNA helicase RuvA
MVRPVRDIACGIQDQDRSMLATLPGVGEALAERIIAKLRRKVGKFALAVESASGPSLEPGTEEAAAETHDAQILRETFAALLSVGHTESQARQLIDKATTSKRRYQSVADLIEAIYAAGQSR